MHVAQKPCEDEYSVSEVFLSPDLKQCSLLHSRIHIPIRNLIFSATSTCLYNFTSNYEQYRTCYIFIHAYMLISVP